jgi:hypothetical protein
MSRELRTYTFTVVVEPADDMWRAYCPTLLVSAGLRLERVITAARRRSLIEAVAA